MNTCIASIGPAARDQDKWKWFLQVSRSSLNPPGPRETSKNLMFSNAMYSEKIRNKSLLILLVHFKPPYSGVNSLTSPYYILIVTLYSLIIASYSLTTASHGLIRGLCTTPPKTMFLFFGDAFGRFWGFIGRFLGRFLGQVWEVFQWILRGF